MIVRPLRRGLDIAEPDWRQEETADEVRTIASQIEDGLFIECVTIQPASAFGRKATLWIPPPLADAMLRELRGYGRDRRRA